MQTLVNACERLCSQFVWLRIKTSFCILHFASRDTVASCTATREPLAETLNSINPRIGLCTHTKTNRQQ